MRELLPEPLLRLLCYNVTPPLYQTRGQSPMHPECCVTGCAAVCARLFCWRRVYPAGLLLGWGRGLLYGTGSRELIGPSVLLTQSGTVQRLWAGSGPPPGANPRHTVCSAPGAFYSGCNPASRKRNKHFHQTIRGTRTSRPFALPSAVPAASSRAPGGWAPGARLFGVHCCHQ